jgi:hypothetical protein
LTWFQRYSYNLTLVALNLGSDIKVDRISHDTIGTGLAERGTATWGKIRERANKSRTDRLIVSGRRAQLRVRKSSSASNRVCCTTPDRIP